MSLLLFLVTFIAVPPLFALDNGVALTPPMGWLSWMRFGCTIDCNKHPQDCINENLYMTMADRLIQDGYRDLGYVFVNIDDCWSEMERDNKTKQLVADKKRFPHGIKWLAKYMHDRGLKLGIYADYGTHTCAGYPGSLGYLDIDAETFASWEIDSVKFDGCNNDAKDAKNGFPAFGEALNKTGRPIVYSSEWPLQEWAAKLPSDYKAIAKSCNLWRNFFDIDASFKSIKSIINHYAENWDHFLEVSGPGNFNDPDMLVIGDYSGLNLDQKRVHFGMWAMFAAPLYMSNDLRKIDNETAAILKNKFVVAIDQDPLGISGVPAFNDGHVQIWTRKLSRGYYAVAALNFKNGRVQFSKSLFDLGLLPPSDTLFSVVDVFDENVVGPVQLKDPVKYYVNPTGIRMFLFVPLT